MEWTLLDNKKTLMRNNVGVCERSVTAWVPTDDIAVPIESFGHGGLSYFSLIMTTVTEPFLCHQ